MGCVRSSNQLEPSGAARMRGGRIFFGASRKCQAQSPVCLAPHSEYNAPGSRLKAQGSRCLVPVFSARYVSVSTRHLPPHIAFPAQGSRLKAEVFFHFLQPSAFSLQRRLLSVHHVEAPNA